MPYWTAHLKGQNDHGHNVVAVGHKVYAFANSPDGGIGVHIFNTVSLRWRALPPERTASGERPLEVPFRFDTKVMLFGHSIYVWGGAKVKVDPFLPHDCELYTFNVNLHKWFKPVVSGAVPRAMRHPCALGKFVYLCGGYTLTSRSGYKLNDVYKLDTGTMVWSVIRQNATTDTLYSSTIVVVSKMFGLDADCWDSGAKPKLQVFDTDAERWLSLLCVPEGCVGCWSFTHDGELYIYQGEDWSYLWKLKRETLSWRRVELKGGSPRIIRYPRFFGWCSCGDRVLVFGAELPSDVHVLEFSPSLKTLCKLAVIRHDGVHLAEVPGNVWRELAVMTPSGTTRHFRRLLRRPLKRIPDNTNIP